MDTYTGQRFGDYRLVRSLGEGTYGDVYYAEHVYQKIPAAVKVFKIKLTPAKFKKFLNEVRTVLLKHPNIVPIIDFGIRDEDDLAYLVMEYAPNGTFLARHPRGTRLPLPVVSAYVNQIASALQYAHDNRRIHRDVKPANILFGANNELLLSDFGLVVVAHTDTSRRIEDALGSPAYMAPEQWKGQPLPASDQYALAIMVYQWLCGELPFTGTNEWQFMNQHTQDSPPPLRQKNPAIPVAVEQVVMKALEKDPEQRFRSVQAFADALAQAHQPKILPGTTLLTNRGHSGAVLSIAWSPDGRKIASVGGSFDHTVHVWEVATGKRLIEHQVYRGNSVAWSPDGQLIASGICNGTPYVWESTTGKPIAHYDVHHGYIIHEVNIAWSPDGKLIAFGTGDRTVHLREAATGKLITHYEAPFMYVYSLAWSPDGKLIALGGPHSLQVLEYHSEKLIADRNKFDDDHAYGAQSSIAWSPDGQLIASGSGNLPRLLQEDSYNTAQVWEAATGKLITQYTGHASSVNSVAWSPDGKYIASGSDDQTVQVWEAVTAKQLLIYSGHRNAENAGMICTVAWSPDGKYIASGSHDSTVQVWQAVLEEKIREKNTGISSAPTVPDTVVAKLIEQGRFEKNPAKAIEAYNQVLALDPNNTDALWGKAVLLSYKQAKYEEALSLYDQILSLNPNDRDALAEKANVLHVLKRYEEEIQIYDELVKENPYLGTERDFLRVYKGRNFEEALHDCDVAINQNPMDAAAYRKKGNILNDMGQSDEAKRYFDTANKIDEVTTLIEKADALRKLERHEEALQLYNQALALDPKNQALLDLGAKIGEVLWKKAYLLRDSHKYEEALQILDQLHILSRLYRNRSKKDKGHHFLEEIAILDSKADLFHKAKRFLEEIKVKEASAKLSSWYHRSRGHAIRLDSRNPWYDLLKEALENYDKEIAANPQDSALIEGRDQVLREFEKLDEELQKQLQPIEEAIRLNPHDNDALGQKGYWLEWYGREEEAQEAFILQKVQIFRQDRKLQEEAILNGNALAEIQEKVEKLEIDKPAGTAIEIYQGHSGRVDFVAWSPDGRYIISESDGKVHVWVAATGNRIAEYYHKHSQWEEDRVAWSPDGKYIAVIEAENNTVQIWNPDAGSGSKIAEYKEHPGRIASVSWSPDGSSLVSGDHNGTIHLWDAVSGKKRVACEWYRGVDFVAWSPDGSSILTADRGGTACVWEAATGKRIGITNELLGTVFAIAWSSDGRYFVTASDEGVHVCDATPTDHWIYRIAEYKGHSHYVYSVSWSPDGKFIASGSNDKTVHVWIAPK